METGLSAQPVHASPKLTSWALSHMFANAHIPLKTHPKCPCEGSKEPLQPFTDYWQFRWERWFGQFHGQKLVVPTPRTVAKNEALTLPWYWESSGPLGCHFLDEIIMPNSICTLRCMCKIIQYYLVWISLDQLGVWVHICHLGNII